VHDANHGAHPLCLCVEIRFAQYATDEVSGFILAYGQNHERVSRVTQRASIETQIAGKECGTGQRQRKRNDFLVLKGLSGEFMTNLPNGNAPASQQLPLAFESIFVQNVRALAGSNPSS